MGEEGGGGGGGPRDGAEEEVEEEDDEDDDNDGDPDLFATTVRGGNYFFENDGTGSFTDMTEVAGLGYVGHSSGGVFFDYDKDGDLDVAASSWVLGNQFAWFENDGSPAQGEWKKHLIERDIPETRTMRAADFDGDGDMDLLGTMRRAHAKTVVTRTPSRGRSIILMISHSARYTATWRTWTKMVISTW